MRRKSSIESGTLDKFIERWIQEHFTKEGDWIVHPPNDLRREIDKLIALKGKTPAYWAQILVLESFLPDHIRQRKSPG